ncbi:MarR family winged helix-turn-helix transcriptional regulator [Herbiconiux liangxiaofengii]|uniref:MarR family winged helix-turn-helix transcriptional regulator n=1 Tax=Herbiconiux liangxiaofengii TaxID=3342795 RepID=UPI0035B8C2E1
MESGSPSERDVVDEIRDGWRVLRPEIDTSAIEVAGRILRAAALLTRRGDEFLARFGLTRGEFDILSALRRHDAPQSPGLLRTVSLATGPATTKRLRSLAERALIVRSANPDDGRGALIELTAAGVALIDEVFPQLLELEGTLLDGIPPGDSAQVAASLRLALASIERP